MSLFITAALFYFLGVLTGMIIMVLT